MADHILEGSLRAISVPDVLTFINMVKKTGALTLRLPEHTKKVYWERGEMVFAASSDPEESLGSFLIRHGKITQEQNMKSGLLVEPGRRQGKILVQMGILTPKELWWAVKNQVLEIIYSVFAARDGWFLFEETETPHEEKIKLSTTTTNIIMEGIRRLDEWPRIKEMIPGDRLVPELAPVEARDRNVRFLEGEREILALVDGRRCVREIVHLSHLDEFETLRILMSFILARYVVLPEGPSAAPAEEEDDTVDLESLIASYNHIFSRISGMLDGHLSRDEIYELFAGALAAAEDPVLDGAGFDPVGLLDPKVLTANVAELSVEKRQESLDAGLNNLLSFLLFESSKHLSADEKSALFRMVGERSA
jgi:hypothetical protein